MEKILTNRKISYRILDNSIRFYGILDKNAMESISIVKKILQDPTRFYRILDKNAMEFMSIVQKMLQDLRKN